MRTRTLSYIIILLTLAAFTSGVKLEYAETLDLIDAQKLFTELFCSGCIPSNKVCQDNINFVASLKNSGYFNLSKDPFINNELNITTVDMLLLTSNGSYHFPSIDFQNKSMISLLMLPKTSKIKGIISYLHPTVFGRNNGPSSLKATYKAIGGLFASAGYAVLFPQYLGYRGDTNSHPYILFPESQIRALTIALNDLVDLNIWNQYYQEMEHIRLYCVGFSEGAGYSLWFSKCVEFPSLCPYFTNDSSSTYRLRLNKTYILMKVAGLDGAYDIDGVVKPFLLGNVSKLDNVYWIQSQDITNAAKPGLTSLAIISFQEYVLNKSVHLSYILNEGFYRMRCTYLKQSFCQIDEKQYNLESVLEVDTSSMEISTAIFMSAAGKQTPPYPIRYIDPRLGSLQFTVNSISSLVEKKWLQDERFLELLTNATIVEFAKETFRETFIFSLMNDSVVSRLNSVNFMKAGENNKKLSSYYFPNEQHKVCGLKVQPVDHLTAEPLACIFALAFFEGK